MSKSKKHRININRIYDSLKEVQDHFKEINQDLLLKREPLSDRIIDNMILGYRYIDQLLVMDEDIFDQDRLDHMLELNHIVLCGGNSESRAEHYKHILSTRDRYYNFVTPIWKWVKKHKSDSTWKVASEVYVGILSSPQLYFEGNHRTGALIVSYCLMRGGYYPFVLTLNNARAYFNPSSEIKFSDKRNIKGKLKLPKYKKRFKEFLKMNVEEGFVY